MEGSETFLMESYERLIWMAHERGMISDDSKAILESMPHNSLEELETCYNDLLHMIRNQEYYRLLERIEKGEQMIGQEANDLKRKKYQDHLNALIAEMESKRPIEHRVVHDESA